jgi:hypothetical protein
VSHRFAADYSAQDVALAKATYLTVARVLGDHADTLVVVGGFVPYLLVPQEGLGVDDAHIGTADLDIVLHIGLLDEEAYKSVSELMRESEFEPDKKPDTGALVPQRWVAPGSGGKAIVEFLIPPSKDQEPNKWVKNLERDFAAFLLPGGELAFQDARTIDVSGVDLRRAQVIRAMQVCGPASFLVLKALAHKKRDKPKDAYDINYLVSKLPGGNAKIIDAFRALGPSEVVEEALGILAAAFETLDSSGPVDVAIFLGDAENEDIRRDVSARVLDLLQDLEEARVP